MTSDVFCVYGTQNKHILTANDGTEYKLFGQSSHRTGFFMITWRDQSENLVNLLKFVKYIHSKIENQQ